MWGSGLWQNAFCTSWQWRDAARWYKGNLHVLSLWMHSSTTKPSWVVDCGKEGALCSYLLKFFSFNVPYHLCSVFLIHSRVTPLSSSSHISLLHFSPRLSSAITFLNLLWHSLASFLLSCKIPLLFSYPRMFSWK